MPSASPRRDPIASVILRFALGRLVAVMGAQMAFIAVSWELYERTHDAWSLGLVGVAELLPVLLFTLVAGNAADRLPRRAIGMAAHALVALALLGLAVASALRAPTISIYALLFVLGTARTFSSPATNTIMPQLLPIDRFERANAWLASSFELAVISGPAIGGAIIAATGRATNVYVIAAITQLGFIAALASMPAVASSSTGVRRSARDLLAGLRFILRRPVFLGAITLDLFAVLLGGAVALLPVFAKDILAVGPAGLGWLRAAPAVGAMSMALLATRLAPWKRPGVVLLLAVAGFGLATVGFGLARSFALALFFLFFTGVFDSISVVIRSTLEQVLTPDQLRGRVAAVHFVFIGFSNELGAFESGASAALVGPVASVVLGGVGALLVVLAVARLCPQLARLGPLATLGQPGDPSAAEAAAAPQAKAAC